MASSASGRRHATSGGSHTEAAASTADSIGRTAQEIGEKRGFRRFVMQLGKAGQIGPGEGRRGLGSRDRGFRPRKARSGRTLRAGWPPWEPRQISWELALRSDERIKNVLMTCDPLIRFREIRLSTGSNVRSDRLRPRIHRLGGLAGEPLAQAGRVQGSGADRGDQGRCGVRGTRSRRSTRWCGRGSIPRSRTISKS